VADLGVRDALWLGVVVGSMVAVMTSFVVIFLSGLDYPDVPKAIRSGAVSGLAATVIVATFALHRLREQSNSGRDLTSIKEAEVTKVRAILAQIEDLSPGPEGSGWRVDVQVRRDRGVLVIDLHGLDAASSSALTERLLERRSDLGKLKLITGKGEITSPASADPGIRPAVLQRLKIGAAEAEWQVIQKSSSIVLRPMGRAPTPGQWAARFAVFVVPMTGAMSLAFRDLAGSSFEEQGMMFGAAAGLLMTGLLSSYRDRSS